MIKKLCFFTTGFAPNRQIFLEYMEKILPPQMDLFLFVTSECKEKFHCKRIKLHESNSNKYFSFFSLRKFCKRNEIDRIVNLGSLPQEGFVMAFASLLANTDFIGYMLTDPIGSIKLKFDKWWIKFFFEDILNYFLAIFPKRILFCSEDIMEQCKRYLFFSRRKIFQLPYPLDISLFTPKNKISLRKKLKIPAKQKTIIFVGRIEYNKGADIILNIAKRNTDILFILIGKLSPKINVAFLKNLRLLPAVSSKELSDYYSAADLCLFPSRAEAFGLVPREAMACGTPAIVSDITALRLINPAIKVPLDSEKIQKEIRGFFNLSAKERKKLSKISRDFVINECSLETCKDLYHNLLLN